MVLDEPASVAGTAKGPTPTDCFIASVALCDTVHLARNAAIRDLDLQALETTATGHWDLKGLFEIGGTDPSFRAILVEARVRTNSPVEKAVDVAPMTHRRPDSRHVA